ncbi:hypothetical protein JCM8547_005068 [Rhodosporidiobolus lusitaniae]
MATLHRTLSTDELANDSALKNAFWLAAGQLKTVGMPRGSPEGEVPQLQSNLRKARSALAKHLFDRIANALAAFYAAQQTKNVEAEQQAEARFKAEFREMYMLFAFDLDPEIVKKETAYWQQVENASNQADLERVLQKAQQGVSQLVEFFHHKQEQVLGNIVRQQKIALANDLTRLEHNEPPEELASQPEFLRKPLRELLETGLPRKMRSSSNLRA